MFGGHSIACRTVPDRVCRRLTHTFFRKCRAVNGARLLNAYNLIVLGDVTSKSHVNGKAYIGGNANGGEYNSHNVKR